MKFYCVLFHYFISVYIVSAYKAVKTQKDGEVSAIMEEKLTCYSQTCENKDVGNGVYRWKCATENEGVEELCDGEAFCFEGREDDNILRMCIKRADYIKKYNIDEWDKMQEAEDPCTADKMPKLIPLFYQFGQECYCFTSLCNKKIELPAEFDVKGYKRSVEFNYTIS